jgi:Zinc knuckle
MYNGVNVGLNAVSPPRMGVTPEMVMALMQSGRGKEQLQTGMSTMLCYGCGQYGHRANDCNNPRNFELVSQVLKAKGQFPCPHCGRFGHPPALCWNLSENAHSSGEVPSTLLRTTRAVMKQDHKRLETCRLIMTMVTLVSCH